MLDAWMHDAATPRERLGCFAQMLIRNRKQIQRGIDDGVFLMTGSLDGGAGGAVIATGLDREALDVRIQDDPFVRHRVVVPEVRTILPSRIAPQLAAVLGPDR